MHLFDPKMENIHLLAAEFETVPNTDPAKPLARKMKAGLLVFCWWVETRDGDR